MGRRVNAERISSRKSRQPNVVFLNRGDGGFDAQTLSGEALHRGAAFGDGALHSVVSEPPERLVERGTAE